MILAIDIGNTNIVLGCMEHDRILVEARMATDLLKTSDQYCVELKNLVCRTAGSQFLQDCRA